MDLDRAAGERLAAARFLVLGTVDPDGRPRVSPVWFSLVDRRRVYWLSSPEAHHSRNLGRHPEVSMVAFDSEADPHTGQAVYLDATAEQVPDAELDAACAEAFAGVEPALAWDRARLADSPLVLWRATITHAEIHVRGSDPEHGTGVDRRVPVQLS